MIGKTEILQRIVHSKFTTSVLGFKACLFFDLIQAEATIWGTKKLPV